jgi:hypothetical protein
MLIWPTSTLFTYVFITKRTESILFGGQACARPWCSPRDHALLHWQAGLEVAVLLSASCVILAMRQESMPQASWSNSCPENGHARLFFGRSRYFPFLSSFLDSSCSRSLRYKDMCVALVRQAPIMASRVQLKGDWSWSTVLELQQSFLSFVSRPLSAEFMRCNAYACRCCAITIHSHKVAQWPQCSGNNANKPLQIGAGKIQSSHPNIAAGIHSFRVIVRRYQRFRVGKQLGACN